MLVYRSEVGKAGLDSFTYEVEEPRGDRKRILGTVWVGVAPPTVEPGPIAYPDLAYAQPGVPRIIDVLRNDVPAGKVELVDVEPLPLGVGTVVREGRSLRFTAAPALGKRTVQLRYAAGLGGQRSTAVVTVRVDPRP